MSRPRLHDSDDSADREQDAAPVEVTGQGFDPGDDPSALEDPHNLFGQEAPVDPLERARLLRAAPGRDSFTVDESSMGRAVGQWVLAVRCECGRRWFEDRETYHGECPHCGKFVYIDIEPVQD